MAGEASGWFDWSAADLLWERLSETAVLACQRGDERAAASEVKRALHLAMQHFSRGDPRFAAAYISQAMLQGNPQSPEATILREHARQTLEETWAWLPGVAGSEDEAKRLEAARELIEELRVMVDDQVGTEEDVGAARFEIWKRERVRLEAGLRKVAAAALLAVVAPCRVRAADEVG